MSGNPRPELVIAIDFGMTCTGVAFANISTGEETVRWLQKWPGRSNAVENKVCLPLAPGLFFSLFFVLEF